MQTLPIMSVSPCVHRMRDGPLGVVAHFFAYGASAAMVRRCKFLMREVRA